MDFSNEYIKVRHGALKRVLTQFACKNNGKKNKAKHQFVDLWENSTNPKMAHGPALFRLQSLFHMGAVQELGVRNNAHRPS